MLNATSFVEVIVLCIQQTVRLHFKYAAENDHHRVLLQSNEDILIDLLSSFGAAHKCDSKCFHRRRHSPRTLRIIKIGRMSETYSVAWLGFNCSTEAVP